MQKEQSILEICATLRDLGKKIEQENALWEAFFARMKGGAQ